MDTYCIYLSYTNKLRYYWIYTQFYHSNHLDSVMRKHQIDALYSNRVVCEKIFDDRSAVQNT